MSEKTFERIVFALTGLVALGVWWAGEWFEFRWWESAAALIGAATGFGGAIFWRCWEGRA